MLGIPVSTALLFQSFLLIQQRSRGWLASTRAMLEIFVEILQDGKACNVMFEIDQVQVMSKDRLNRNLKYQPNIDHSKCTDKCELVIL